MIGRIEPSGSSRWSLTLDEMLGSRVRFDQVLNVYGIKHRGIDRFHHAYKTLEDYKEKRDIALANGLQEVPGYDTSAKIKNLLNSFHDCWELATVLYRIEEEEYNLMSKALKVLLTGVKDRYHPNGSNAKGRDLLFELTMLANLKRARLKTRFAEHPDILVSISNHTYAIECKRLSSQSESALQRNLHNASIQLGNNLQGDVKGVVAISIGDYLHGENVVVNAKTAEEADARVEDLVGNFIANNHRVWQNTDALGKHVIGVIFYTSFISELEDEEIPHNTVFTLLGTPGPDADIDDVGNFLLDFQALNVPENGWSADKKGVNFVTQ